MVKASDLVVDLKDIDRDDVLYVGEKSANLGEMMKADFPVPGGFVITAHAYFTFIKNNRLDEKIKHLLGTIDYNNSDSVSKISTQVRRLIKRAEIPEDIVKEVFASYEKMGKGGVFVAMRPSSTSEDSKDASFAEPQETFLNVKGEAAVLDTVRQVWASLFSTRAVYHRHKNKLDPRKNGVSLIVQRMVEADASGIMFTVDPVEIDKTKVVVEAIFGLGEYAVDGKVIPDIFDVDKKTGRILTKKVAEQEVMLIKKGHGNEEKKIPLLKRKKQKISDLQVKALAKVAQKIEKHYYFPQEIEWAMEKGRLYIVQTRPITTLGTRRKINAHDATASVSKLQAPVLVGDPASRGIGVGSIKIIKSPKEIGKVSEGDILVTSSTDSDYVPAMKKAAAIVTEKGGLTSHAAIISREFGVPAVVGAASATKVLNENTTVTVNGRTGEIYKGSVVSTDKLNGIVEHSRVSTKTRILVNLAEPELANKISEYPADGIGLLRAEFMIAEIGVHPKKMIEEGRQREFVNQLVDSLKKCTRAFYPRPVLYRATDFKTNEYRNLKGGKEYEPYEENPMLGYRGAFRYIRDERVFRLELEAIKKVREEYNNLQLTIPFVRTVKELRHVKEIINKNGLRRGSTFKLYMTVEVPSNVMLINDFIEVGIDGISIDAHELTMLTLGLDSNNEEIAVEFDVRNPAVLWSLQRVIKAAKKYKISASICGQAPSTYPDLLEKLVEWGVTSISVAPDAIDSTRDLVARIEKRK